MREATHFGTETMPAQPEKGTDGNSARTRAVEEISSAAERPDKVNHRLALVPALPPEQPAPVRRMRPTIACMLVAGIPLTPGRRPGAER